LLNKSNESVLQKLFARNLDRLQVCQVELQEMRFFSGALLEVTNGGFTLGLVATSNVYLGVVGEEDLVMKTSA
jgi:hypothetical protein